jgi:hypothetical protein
MDIAAINWIIAHVCEIQGNNLIQRSFEAKRCWAESIVGKRGCVAHVNLKIEPSSLVAKYIMDMVKLGYPFMDSQIKLAKED